MSYPSKVIIQRTLSNSHCTIGKVLVVKNGITVFVADTLELPWLNNKIKQSCIPAGSYRCERTWSPKLQRYEYEVMSVPGRKGIRFDIANYVKDLLGCIALGKLELSSDLKEVFYLRMSRSTNAEFRANLENANFALIIYNPII